MTVFCRDQRACRRVSSDPRVDTAVRVMSLELAARSGRAQWPRNKGKEMKGLRTGDLWLRELDGANCAGIIRTNSIHLVSYAGSLVEFRCGVVSVSAVCLNGSEMV